MSNQVIKDKQIMHFALEPKVWSTVMNLSRLPENRIRTAYCRFYAVGDLLRITHCGIIIGHFKKTGEFTGAPLLEVTDELYNEVTAACAQINKTYASK